MQQNILMAQGQDPKNALELAFTEFESLTDEDQIAFEAWLDTAEGKGWLEYGEVAQRFNQGIPA